jgi:integrase
VAKVYRLLRTIMATAVEDGLLRSNPVRGAAVEHSTSTPAGFEVDQSLTYVAGRGPSLGPPKSEAAYRTVSLPSTTREILQAHVNTYGYHDRYSLVFTTVTGKLLLNRYFAPFWRRAKANADVDPAVRFHDLRHLAGTTAASAGASLREIMTRMG